MYSTIQLLEIMRRSAFKSPLSYPSLLGRVEVNNACLILPPPPPSPIPRIWISDKVITFVSAVHTEPVYGALESEPRNRFQGMNSASLCCLAGRYYNPIPTRFLAPIDCFKIPALFQHILQEPRQWRNIAKVTKLFSKYEQNTKVLTNFCNTFLRIRLNGRKCSMRLS